MIITLVNPNTSHETTAAMVEIAREETTGRAEIVGVTARSGAPLITDPQALAAATRAVEDLTQELKEADAVILAAFGDPGLRPLRDCLDCYVTGIAEAGMAEAGQDGRPFAVVTTTPQLCKSISASAQQYGHRHFLGTWTTPGDPTALMRTPATLTRALEDACDRAITEGGAQAVVIGGGPLARAARSLSRQRPVPIIEPLPAAVRLTLERLNAAAEA
ncbi:MAG: aspartate/glutamate racemase family protein [Pseudomonadota bacterium]